MHITTINLIRKDYAKINIEFYWMERKTILMKKISLFPLNPNNPNIVVLNLFYIPAHATVLLIF